MRQLLCIIISMPLALSAQPIKLSTTDIGASSYKTIDLPERPDFLTDDQDNAWVIDDNHNRVQKISINKPGAILSVSIPGACAAPVSGFNALWVLSCKEKTLYKINRSTGKVIARIRTGIADGNGEMSLAAGAGSIWLLTNSNGILSRINPCNNKVEANIKVKPGSYCAAFGYQSVWVSNTDSNSVQRIDAKKNSVIAETKVGKQPRFISVGSNGIWTLNQGDGSVTKINPVSNKATVNIDVHAKGGGGDIAAGDDKVWIVSTNTESPVQTIDATTYRINHIYTQKDESSNDFRVDGAVRVSKKYTWISGLYRRKVWVFINK